jgi:hypothetical protein
LAVSDDAELRHHLLELARRIDPGPLRGRIRAALVSRDRNRFREAQAFSAAVTSK